MPRLRFSALSRADLEEIWDYIATDSPRRADEVLDRLSERCSQLRAQPLIGHRRDEVSRGLRCVNAQGYAIFYRVSPSEVGISRIIHHSRHLPDLDFDEP